MIAIPLSTPPIAKQYYPIEYSIRMQQETDLDKSNFNIIDYTATSSVNTIKNRISEIGELSDNWDGYEAISPSSIVVKNSFKFVTGILNTLFSSYLVGDDITPTPYGTIVFEFNSDKGMVSVEIGEKQLGYFTDFEGSDNYLSDGVETDFRSIPDELKSVLSIL